MLRKRDVYATTVSVLCVVVVTSAAFVDFVAYFSAHVVCVAMRCMETA